MKQRVLSLHKIIFSDWESPIGDLNESCRVFHKIALYLVQFPDHTTNYFWLVFGDYIQQLTLEKCIVKKHKLLAILTYLRNLEELTICDCNEMLNRWPEDDSDEYRLQLHNLKRIRFRRITILKPYVFDYLFDMAPNLEELEVTDCFKKCPNAVMRKKMVDHCILSLVRKKHQIRSLFMHGTAIDDLDLMQLVNIEGLRLTKLSLTFTGRMTNPAMLDTRRSGLRNKKIVGKSWGGLGL